MPIVWALLACLAAPLPSCTHNGQASPQVHPAWRFAFSNDSRAAGGAAAVSNGVATVVVGAIARDIAAQGVDFVLFPGDLVVGAGDDAAALGAMLRTWKQAMAPVYAAGIPVYVTRGNHEYRPGASGAANPADPSRAPFLAEFPALPQNGPGAEKGLTWSLTHKNAKLIGFDQYANRTASYDSGLFVPGSNHGQAMNPWVLDEVNASAQPLTFVVAHEQMWPSATHPDCLANDPDSRDALVHALGRKRGVYLSGHDHMFIRALMTNDLGERVPALVVGTGGGGNYDYQPFDALAAGYTGPARYLVQKTVASGANPTFGYLLVTVNPDDTWSAELRGFQFVRWNDPTDVALTPWAVWDSFTSGSMLQ